MQRNLLTGWKLLGLVGLASGLFFLAHPSALAQQQTPPAAESTPEPKQDPKTEQPAQEESRQGENKNQVLGIDLDAITQFAKRNGARKFSKLAPEMVELTSPLVKSVSPSTVRIYRGKTQVAIGTVVDSNGFILTIAGELKPDLMCKLPDGSTKEARVVGIDQETGLALLKVDAQGLLPAHMTPSPTPEVGSWLASVSPDSNPVGLGVVSVQERQIIGGGAFLGIRMDPANSDKPGVLIIEVVFDSPAFKSGLQVGDRITRVAGQDAKDVPNVQETLRKFTAGDKIEIAILRGSEEKTFDIVLAARDKFETVRNEQDRMGSTLSQRRQGFQVAFQHDTFLQANECGSPIVDLNGKIVGINVSRSGRVSTLALPVQVVIPAVERLKSGQLAPEIINAKRISQIEIELEQLLKAAEPLTGNLAEKETEWRRQQDKVQALKEVLAEMEAKLKTMESAADSRESEMKSIREQMAELQVKTKRLQDELEGLRSGANVR